MAGNESKILVAPRITGTKYDAEIKLIVGCSLAEMQLAYEFCNRGCMRSLLLERPKDANRQSKAWRRDHGNTVAAGAA